MHQAFLNISRKKKKRTENVIIVCVQNPSIELYVKLSNGPFSVMSETGRDTGS